MKVVRKTGLLLSSALIAGAIFAIDSQVKADTTDNGNIGNTNVLQIGHNDTTIITKASISPVASRDNQTLRQVAASNNASFTVNAANNNSDKTRP